MISEYPFNKGARPLHQSATTTTLHHHHQRPSAAPCFSPFTKVTVRCGVSRDKIVVNQRNGKTAQEKANTKTIDLYFLPSYFVLAEATHVDTKPLCNNESKRKWTRLLNRNKLIISIIDNLLHFIV